MTLSGAVFLSPAKAGCKSFINLIRWWRAARLPPAIIFHGYAVRNRTGMAMAGHFPNLPGCYLSPFGVNHAYPQNKNAATDAAAFLIT